MRLTAALLMLVSCAMLLSCDSSNNSELSGDSGKRDEIRRPCPMEQAVKAEVEKLDKTTDRLARGEILSRIQIMLSSIRAAGFDREDKGGEIIMKPACGARIYSDIRLVSETELLMLLGE